MSYHDSISQGRKNNRLLVITGVIFCFIQAITFFSLLICIIWFKSPILSSLLVTTSLSGIPALCFWRASLYYKLILQSEEKIHGSEQHRIADLIAKEKASQHMIESLEKEKNMLKEKQQRSEENYMKLFFQHRVKSEECMVLWELNKMNSVEIGESKELNRKLIWQLKKVRTEVVDGYRLLNEANNEKEILVSFMKENFYFLLRILESEKNSITDGRGLNNLLLKCKKEIDNLERISSQKKDAEETLINTQQQHGIIIDYLCSALAA
ncbi:hypothetical protein ACTHGU_21290 [Chitinophagaceae bacterium MMS25-I14]